MVEDWMSNAPNPFNSVLIANRGEIACRIIKSCKEVGITTIAIYAPNDKNSLFVSMADKSVELQGDTIAETYLNIEQILNAAKKTNAQAIHPGFGFLSERADFARAVVSEGLIWIGPKPRSISSMGDKVTARLMMKNAGVPVIPGIELAEEHSSQNNFTINDSQVIDAAEKIGYPILIKASAGGGGKGMRVVHDPNEVISAANAASREAINAFGDGKIYVEKLLETSRHIEIQVLGDKHGNVIHLCERECSIQRRHQKVIEEAPSSAINPTLRQRMGSSAIAAAKASSYVGAGTVEFLVDENGDYYFLEMNTRIQVEHPITEMITGVDIVYEQLRIAAGLQLKLKQESVRINGHAIESRIYAEDPSNGFLPATGKLELFKPPDGIGVRLDSGVREGDLVTPDYDPMLAKLVVHAADRNAAIRRMAYSLNSFAILGVKTNISFLNEIILSDEFALGQTTTDFIEKMWPNGWKENISLIEKSCSVAAISIAEQSGIGKTNNYSSRTDSSSQNNNPFFRINKTFP